MITGDKDVGVTAGKLATQCLELGMLDEISFLVPVVLGVAHANFEEFDTGPFLLDGPKIIDGVRVTHLVTHLR